MRDLPSLSEVIKSFSLSAKKSLGQNFLLDLNVTDKISSLAKIREDKKIIEIGAGPGGLTRSILKQNPSHLTVIEKDPRCIEALQILTEAYPETLTILEGDVLTYNLQDIYEGESYHIMANLPYNISSHMVIKLLTESSWPPRWESAFLMFQKEFAERLCASVGTKSYGRLTVLADSRVHVKKCYVLHPRYFTPPPKVTSYVMELIPHHQYAEEDMKRLAVITQATFSQRRKMLRKSLRSIFQDPMEVCEQCHIDPTYRADQITPEDYRKLCRIPVEK